MPKLHQILGVHRGKKSAIEKLMGEAYQTAQKPDLFDGHNRTYRPITGADDPLAEKLPPESKKIQYRVIDLTKKVNDHLIELIDVITTLDVGNQSANADIVVDGVVLAKNVPSTTLLFLMKELENVRTFVSKLPTPDPAKTWLLDASQNQLATPATETHRTRKVQEPVVVVAATPEHPAQVQVMTKDVVAGYWTTIEYTARIPVVEKEKMLARVGKLMDAVKMAKEKANDVEVEKQMIGASLLRYVFGEYAG